MTEDPRVQSESNNGASATNHKPASQATEFFSDSSNLAQVAQTLAAHGGGDLSVELALDLVLNEVVEQARAATGATGAAVALFRDGELTCRATAGENAPDLGVRVDATSSLAGACVTTGEIQQCRDTESDSRINAEACRRLGVRSMLMAPLVDHNQTIGIIQVFSAWPNAFGKREMSALQVLAGRIAESTREAEAGIPTEPSGPPHQEAVAIATSVVTEPEPFPTAAAEQAPIAPIPEEKPSAFWSLALMVLVIATAVTLGVVIGWRRAANIPSIGHAKAATAAAAPETPAEVAKAESTEPPAAPAKAAARSAVPPGGLVVTENGKIVYRSAGSGSSQPQRLLIHRVEPVYPEDARAQRIQGSVVLDVQVLGTGNVGRVGVISGNPILTQAAVDAVKQWRYQPDSANGDSAESQLRVTVKFTLPAS